MRKNSKTHTMNRYQLGHTLGEGAFGKVVQAVHKESGQQVAIKTLKDKCRDTAAMTALPEVKALNDLSHKHIVKCKEVIRDRRGGVHLVFELLPGGNLEALTRTHAKPLSEMQIRTIFCQLLQAIHHMHSKQYMHRDVKPENILLTSAIREDAIHIKLADLGLAKSLKSVNRPHTTYISTRWYRSPEILLRLSDYAFASDMWAVGTVMAELVAHGQPLLPGDNEHDQLALVIALRGHPRHTGWRQGESALRTRGIDLPFHLPKPLQNVLPKASAPVLQLISDLLELDPRNRPTAREALDYPVFVGLDTLASRVPSRCDWSRVDSRRDTARTCEFPSGRWSGNSDEDRDEDRDGLLGRTHAAAVKRSVRAGDLHGVAGPPEKKVRAGHSRSSDVGRRVGDSSRFFDAVFQEPHVEVDMWPRGTPAETFDMRMAPKSR